MCKAACTAVMAGCIMRCVHYKPASNCKSHGMSALCVCAAPALWRSLGCRQQHVPQLEASLAQRPASPQPPVAMHAALPFCTLSLCTLSVISQESNLLHYKGDPCVPLVSQKNKTLANLTTGLLDGL